MDPLIITAAITGAETSREMNPNLPITPEEQAVAAKECVEAGAAIIHLHVRDDKGRPTQSLDRFRESIEAIRKSCSDEVIIQISTGGAVGDSMEERMAPIEEFRPEMASLNVSTMNFGDEVFVNEPEDVRALAKRMKELGVLPEIEIYDAGHMDEARRLVEEELIRRPVHYQFVLGVSGGLSGEERNLAFLIDSIEERDTWAVAGIGRWELPCAAYAVRNGGFVRVGFEDNVYYEKDELAVSNAQLVRRVARLSGEIGRPVAKPAKAREILGID